MLELLGIVCTEPGLAGIRLQGIPASAATVEPRFGNITHCPWAALRAQQSQLQGVQGTRESSWQLLLRAGPKAFGRMG